MHEAQTTSTRVLNPFAALMISQAPRRLPALGKVELVVGGKRVTKATKTVDLIDACPMDEEDARDLERERKKLDRERELAYYRNRYQRIKDNPELWARRKAMQAAQNADRREYQKKYRDANRARINEQKRAHAARRRASQTEAQRKARADAERDRYRRKREQLLQQRRDERANNREEVNERQRLRRLQAKEKARKIAEKLLRDLEQKGGAA
jgi:hypothetical protein